MSWDKIYKQISGKVTELKSTNSLKGNLQTQPPWMLDDLTDPFFAPIDLGKETWTRANGLFPYRLVVIDVSNDNNIISAKTAFKASAGQNRDRQVIKNESNTGGVQYSIGSSGSWVFTLPITPQQLSITDQFAINTTATMRGVVEEHNGVKFKIISASGTTGIWPTRDSFTDNNTAGLGLFGGALSAIGGAVNSWKSITGKAAPKSPDPSEVDPQRTGYYQALLLQQFLEQYAIAKKNPANKNWRLVFDCPKTNESFVITPMQYSVTRSQRSPSEFLYNMQFKAWKRVKIGGTPSQVTKKPEQLTPNFFQKAVVTLDNARSAMSASLNVIKAVRADFRQVFDQARKVTLLYKDLGGLAFSVSDLPNQISRDIIAATKKRSVDIAQGDAAFQAAFGVASQKNKVSSNKIKKTVQSIKENNGRNQGLSDDEIQAGALGKEAKDANKTSDLNNVFNEPEANFDFFNAITIDELSLTPQQVLAIQTEIEKNSFISIQEIKEITKNLQNMLLDITNNFGAGDAFFSKIYGRPVPKERAIPMSLEEFELVTALEEAILVLNISTATRNLDDSRSQNSLEYVGGLADDSGIPFDSTSTSKYLAPVPFGLTIEQISARYLNNSDRYNEIITLNNLKSPYIDEEGFFYSFLSNGDGRQFNIESKDKLFIGQKIQLFSNTIPMFTRKITNIEKISDANYLVTIDGVDDLGLLKISEKAKMKAFLPGTVNSQNQIYIPSSQPATEEPRTYDIPFLKEDTLTGLSKIDWLVDDYGDVVVNSFAEMALANGTTNLIQALKMKIMTQKGTLLSNPEYGLGLSPGISVSEVDIENILTDLRDMVLQDPRFSNIENIELNILPPTVSISINAVLANGRGVFPINFSL
jgi:hypothetical protein